MIRARRKERKTLKDFDWRIGAKVLGICTVLGTGFAYASQRYVIGLDTQDARCLDEWFFVIDTWRGRTPPRSDATTTSPWH